MKLRVVDGDGYLNLGAQSRQKWVEVDLSDPAAPLASELSSALDGMRRPLEGIEGAVARVEKSGAPELLDGVEVQQYVVSADVAKLSDDLKGSVRSGAVPTVILYLYWIDADDLIHKAVLAEGDSRIEYSYEHWGEPVEVAAPPAEQVAQGVDLADLSG